MVSHMKDEYKIKWEEAERELQEIKQWIDSGRNKFDSKTRYLISYAVIKASGTVEVVFKKIIYDFLSENVKEETAFYIEKMILDSSCNPNVGNMSNILQNISADLRRVFDDMVKQSGKKDKINSLVQLRNDFANGECITVSIETVITYFEAAKEIILILENIVNKNYTDIETE